MRKQLGLWLIMLPVLAWAVPLDKVVAVVNDNVITASELDTEVEQMRQQLLARKIELPSNMVLRKQVLQHLIDEEIQLQLAKTNDLVVDNTELDETIKKIATSNHLTVEALREELARQGMDFDVYRDHLRKEVLLSRVQQNAVGKEIAVSMQQVNDYLKSPEHLEKGPQTFHIQHIVIPIQEEPTSEQLNKARNKAQAVMSKIKQGDDFSRLAIAESSGEYALEGGDLGDRHLAELPEVFAAEVIKMKPGEVVGPIRTGNGFQIIKLMSIGSNQKPHEMTKTHVRHILLKQDVNMTEAEASRQIDNLYQQLKSGKDFALMAQQYSLDRMSAAKGGDLGWVTGEELVPAFTEVMNGLAENVVSKPVKTQFGWHLIQVLGRKTEDDSEAFERQQVRQFLHQRKFTEAVQNWQQHMRTTAYIHIVEKQLA
jgi:peptidyl-prolyl cis-trans isomerase SurA